MTRPYSILIFLALSLGANAQEAAQKPSGPWSLGDCVRYAIEHNLTVRQQSIAVKQSELDLNTAENSRLPGLSASASENFSFGRGLTQDNTYSNANTTSTSFNIGGEVPVFRGFQIKHNIALQRLNLDAANADLEKIKDDIRIAVAKSYVQILYNKEILSVAESQVAVDSMQAERIDEMMLEGKASAAEAAQQKAALGQSIYQRTQARNNLSLALLDLTQLLELPNPDGFGILSPDASATESPLLENPEDIYDRAMGIKASIKAEETRLGAAKTRIDLARSEFYPSLSLSGGVGTNYYTNSRATENASFSSQMRNNFSQFIGLSLNIPIFNRLATRNSVRGAELAFRNQELQLESVRKSLYKEIQQAYYNAVAARDRLESSRVAASGAEESFRLVLAKYENGKANITEFNEAKNGFSKAEADLVQARYEYLYQTKVLDFYKGEELSF